MTQAKRKAHRTILAIDPTSGEQRRFPKVTETHLRRHTRKVLTLVAQRHVVFVFQRGKARAVLVSHDTFVEGRLRALKLKNLERESLERLRLELNKAFVDLEQNHEPRPPADVTARNQPESIDTAPSPEDLLPPGGYRSWLDYAVDTFDTRAVEIELLFVNGALPDRQAMHRIARNELALLRIRAAAAPMPQVPIGTIKALAPAGARYEVGRPLSAFDDGDWMLEIVMKESGQVTERRLSRVLLDPDAP